MGEMSIGDNCFKATESGSETTSTNTLYKRTIGAYPCISIELPTVRLNSIGVPETSALISRPSAGRILCFLIACSPLAFVVLRATAGLYIPPWQPQDRFVGLDQFGINLNLKPRLHFQ